MAYYGGKHGVEPPLGPPPYDYGTDNEVWDENGIPTPEKLRSLGLDGAANDLHSTS